MINAFVNIPVDLAVGAILPFAGARAITNASKVCNGGWLYHADGSGQFQITRPGIYRVDFSAEVTAAAAGDIELTLNTNGEALAGTRMGATLAAADDLANLSTGALVVVPCGASVTITVANASVGEITVDSASLVITRVC